MRQNHLGGAFGDDFAAVRARRRAEVDDPIGGADGFVIVFDDQDGVAQIAQTLEGGQQPVVIARMQAD